MVWISTVHRVQYGVIWCDMVWYGMVQYSTRKTVWHGMVYSMVLVIIGTVQYIETGYGMVWYTVFTSV